MNFVSWYNKHLTFIIKMIGKKSTSYIVIAAIIVSLSSPLFSSKESEKKKQLSFFGKFLEEEKQIWTTPARMNAEDVLAITGLALTTAFLIHNDEKIIREVKEFTLAHPGAKKAGSCLSPLGSAPVDAALIGAFWLGGSLFKDKRLKETAVLSLRSLMHAILVSQVIKLICRRQRPDHEDGVDGWFNSGTGVPYRSFTSGHTAQVWSIATVFSGMYRDKPLIPVISYTLAAFSGLSRITENEHWASDVLTGAVLGYAIGRMMVNRHRSRVIILPEISGDKTALRLSFPF